MASLIGSRKAVEGGTSSALNTTGATLFVATLSGDNTLPSGPTDSQGNTWTKLTERGGSQKVAIYYVLNPTTSSSHTFTDPADTSVTVVMAFDGGPWAFDQQSGASSQTPGALTAAADGAIYVTGVVAGAIFTTVPPTISDGFTVAEYQQLGGGTNWPGGGGYFIQGTAASKNPVWDAVATGGASALATFTPTAPATAVKTYLGLATASVKTTEGLAIASRKTWQGLA